MSDVEVPSFYKYRKKNPLTLPVNPMLSTSTVWSGSPISFGCSYKHWSTRINRQITTPMLSGHPLTVDGQNLKVSTSGTVPGGPASAPEWPNSDILLQKALAKARTASWDMGTFLAELPKTISMISKAGTTMMKRVDTIKSKKSVKTMEEFMSAWLEYRYGWRTLAYDLQDASEAISRLNGKAELAKRYTAYDANKNTVSTSSGPSTSTSYLQWRSSGGPIGTSYSAWSLVHFRANYTHSYERSVRAGVGLTMAADKFAFIDPLVVVSEVMPYLLVVNWFINIKDAAAAFSPFAAGDLKYAFVTTEERRSTLIENVISANPATPPSFQTEVNVTGGSYLNLYESITRNRMPATPSLNLRFRLNMSFGNVIDLISMITLQRTNLLRFYGRGPTPK